MKEPLDTFTESYIACALWTLTDDKGEPCDWADESDIAPETLETLQCDAKDFAESHAPLIKGRESLAGYDFWLTRNGHGAGFWDGDWPENGNELTGQSKAYGHYDLYLGDDGKIYGG